MYITKTLSYDTRARAFWTLVVLSILSLVVYIFAINATIRNTVTRQNLENEVATISTQLGDLEFSYIALKNRVSLDLAYTRGFKNVSSAQYISRGESRSLTMNVTSLSGTISR
ncbi:MAG: hypothetical protein WAV25_01500 [Minisyncoccia bacterium]